MSEYMTHPSGRVVVWRRGGLAHIVNPKIAPPFYTEYSFCGQSKGTRGGRKGVVGTHRLCPKCLTAMVRGTKDA